MLAPPRSTDSGAPHGRFEPGQLPVMDAGSNDSDNRDRAWIATLRWYLPLILTMNLIWEAAQLPLYTIWHERSWLDLGVAVLHCVAGDGIVAAMALVAALVLAGSERWPAVGFARVALVTTAIGVTATIVIEWYSVEVGRRWAYAAAMPVLPILGTGLSPLAQWILLPTAGLAAARRLAKTGKP